MREIALIFLFALSISLGVICFALMRTHIRQKAEINRLRIACHVVETPRM